jgi:hypothetical protein
MYFDEEEVIKELRKRGYRVTKVDFPEVPALKTAKDLVQHFYARRQFYNPNRRFPPSLNYQEDTKLISALLRKREQLGLSRKVAVQEVAVLIETLFKFEEHLKLSEPVLSPRILGVGSIMNRVCTYANGEVDEVSEAETEEFINEVNQIYEKKFAERDSVRAAQSRKRILEKLYEGQGDRNVKGRTERD